MSDQQLPVPARVAEAALERTRTELHAELAPHGIGFVLMVQAPDPTSQGRSYVNYSSNMEPPDRARLLRFYADLEDGVNNAAALPPAEA